MSESHLRGHRRGFTRREALELLGMSAAAAAIPGRALAQAPTFPKGAVIRTILRDYAPEDLAGGATLFHEHMQLGTDFNAKFGAASAAVRAANGLPPAPARGAYQNVTTERIDSPLCMRSKASLIFSSGIT